MEPLQSIGLGRETSFEFFEMDPTAVNSSVSEDLLRMILRLGEKRISDYTERALGKASRNQRLNARPRHWARVFERTMPGRIPDNRPAPFLAIVEILTQQFVVHTRYEWRRARNDLLPKCYQIAVFGLLVLASLAVAKPAQGETLAQWKQLGTWCSINGDLAQGSFDVNSDPEDDHAWGASLKAYNRMVALAQTCKAGHDRDFVVAYMDSWAAQIYHHQGKPWEQKLNLANHLLEQCFTRNRGTEKGAQCETDLKSNFQRESAWKHGE